MTAVVALRLIGFIVCALFILGGSINRGWSGFFWVIPFVLGLLVIIWPWSMTYKALAVLSVAIPCSVLAWDKSSNSLLYPYLSEQATFQVTWGLTSHGDVSDLISPDLIHIYTSETRHGVMYQQQFTALTEPLTLTLQQVDVSNADFGEQRIAIFSDDAGHLYVVYEDSLLRGVAQGTVVSNALNGVTSLQSAWTRYLDLLMMWPMLPVILFSRG